MAKSKNHTAHNQNRKAHRNGLHKKKLRLVKSLRGRDIKYLRNLRRVKKGTEKAIARRAAAAEKTESK